jgi:hypothetical protein
MTEENYKYRTNPMFLRNQFGLDMPLLPKVCLGDNEKEELRLIGFDVAKSDKDTHFNRFVHFFLYDYKFEDIWNNPDKYIEKLSKYKAVLTPDFSMYVEMNENMQRYNTFRNRWVGAYLADKGIRVIPTVNWGLENTFDFCFNGIEKGSTVAVSTYMASAHGNRADQKDFFMAGYNEMLKRIEPETIICYHYPFEEMEGNILFIDYDLSSWQHYDDDKIELPYTQSEKFVLGIDKPSTNSRIVVKYCDNSPFSVKGSGSVYGGQWQPHPDKPEEERFFGEPGEIKHTFKPTKNGGYWIDTKIGNDGRAKWDRHYTDHGYPNAHSNPHDHLITWNNERGNPEWGKQINYFDGNIPELKYYKITGVSKMNTDYNGDYKTKYEFIFSLETHSEIVFEWQGKEYGLFYVDDNKWVLCLDNNGLNNVYFDNIDDIKNYKINNDKLIDICTKFTVIERAL